MSVRRLVAVLAGLVLVAASCGTQAHAHSRPRSSATQIPQPAGGVFGQLHWLVAASGLKQIGMVSSPAFVRRYFDSPRTTIITSAHIPRAYANWDSSFAVDAKSVGALQQVVPSLSHQKFILFDLEHWSFTPVSEQLNPAAAANAAALIAHAADLGIISAPAANLAEVIRPRLNIWQGFLESGLVGAFARDSVAVDIQAQGLEAHTAVYQAFVTQAAAQARQANPNVLVYAGVSTNPSGEQVSAATLVNDIEATRSQVYGYWLNVPSGGDSCPRCGVAQPQVAVSLVSQLAALKVG